MTSALTLALLLLGGSGHARVGVRWERNFEEAVKKAKAARKPIMVDFWAEWCGWCHRLDQTTYVDPVVVRMAEDFVAVKVNSEGSAREVALASRYDVDSLPTILFLSPSGRLLLRLSGFQGPGQFPTTMEKAKDQAGKVIAWENTLERNPAEAAALMALGLHLFEQDFYDESRELLVRASRADESRPVADRKRTRLVLGMIQNHDRRYPEAETALKEGLSLKPAGEYDGKLLFVLARTYMAQGRKDEARAALLGVVGSNVQGTLQERAREMLVALESERKR